VKNTRLIVMKRTVRFKETYGWFIRNSTYVLKKAIWAHKNRIYWFIRSAFM